MTWDKVDLPLPFGPMSAATSPSSTVRSRSSRILRPPTETLRFLTSSTIFPRRNIRGLNIRAPVARSNLRVSDRYKSRSVLAEFREEPDLNRNHLPHCRELRQPTLPSSEIA